MKYIPVGTEKLREGPDEEIQFIHPRSKRSSSLLISVLFCVAFLSSLLFNVYFWIKLPSEDLCRSSYSGLEYDVETVYEGHTDYWGENQTLADELWDSLNTNPVAVALTDEYATEKGLPIAGRFPWDEGKGTYYLKAFHQIHCLKLMRRLTMDLRDGVKSTVGWEHFEHCMDSIRQDVMCIADDTPMHGTLGEPIGDKQVRKCRDWNKLIAWTQATERQACFHTITDYREIAHSLERFSFCPEDSQYYQRSQAYFAKYGHKNPFYD